MNSKKELFHRQNEFFQNFPDTSQALLSKNFSFSGNVQIHGRQVEVDLGQICNNVCTFCVSGQLTQKNLVRQLPTAPIIEVIRLARKKGASEITFIGGEPTIQNAFFPALQCAHEEGYEKITIFTNLARGNDPKFLKKATDLGTFHWRVSIQGGDQATHDLVVGRPGAFARITKGLDWLTARDHPITLNACITAENVDSLPGYWKLIEKYPIQHLHLDMVRADTMGVRSEAYIAKQLPDYTHVANKLRHLLDIVTARKPEFEINVGNFPFCLLSTYAHKIVHGGEETITISPSSEGEYGRTLDKYHYQSIGKTKPDTCKTCVFQSKCRGIPVAVQRKFGSAYLQGVSLQQALSLNRQTRKFIQYGRTDKQHRPSLSKPIQQLSFHLQLLLKQVSKKGWSFIRYLLVPGQEQGIVRLRKHGFFVDIVLDCSPLSFKLHYQSSVNSEPFLQDVNGLQQFLHVQYSAKNHI